MKVFLGTDHAGFVLKEEIKAFLLQSGYDVEDCGALSFDKDDDYPDFISKAAKEVSATEGAMGIIFGKSGAGECITANKIRSIRAFVGFNSESVMLAREHNDANVLSLGSQFVNSQQAKEFAKLFLETPFSNEERHQRRIDKISAIEEEEEN